MWQLHVREVEQRAEEAERTRDEAAQRRAVEERLRIARELHDSLTHSISVIQVQAGVAVHLARKRGEEVPPALLAIRGGGHGRRAGTARDAQRAAQHRGRRRQRPRPAGAPGGALAGGRAAGDGDRDRRRAAAAARRGPGGLPDRAGGAHQRQPARRPGVRVGAPALRARRPDRPGRRRRRRAHGTAARRAPGSAWSACGSGSPRSAAALHGRAAGRRRLPGPRRASRAGAPS